MRPCIIVVLIATGSVLLARQAESAVGPTQRPDVLSADLVSHSLTVVLSPDNHRLAAKDRMILKIIKPSLDRLTFSLNPALHVIRVQAASGDGPFPVLIQEEERRTTDGGIHHVTVQFGRPMGQGQTLELEWEYEGVVNDPPREPRHLRFVTPSETAGHIGPEGVYLSSETLWYPDLDGALATYRLRVTTPQGWQTVSQGQQVSEGRHDGLILAEWAVAAKTEALTLVANQFVKQQRDWNGIEVATYLFPEEASLADEYLTASVRYLELYTRLLGAYPFPKFAVVENFFASGLGMPSFTLLGSGVVRRHYTQPYALGHEIVHSWIGNWVLNDRDGGNWVEGLTTYLANYYYEELTGSSDQAREQRRMLLLGYAVHVEPAEDYPVAEFRHKLDQRDNAIGYQKTAMIFHMLRREIGETAFWNGIRKLVDLYGGAYASWSELEQVFEGAGRTQLRWFFEQWVEREGAPSLSIAEVKFAAMESRSSEGGVMTVRMVQRDKPYRLRLPVRIEWANGRVSTSMLELELGNQTVNFHISGKPVRLQVDPAFEVFRRLDRRSLPPMLNLFVTDTTRSVVIPTGGTDAGREPYQALSARIVAQDARKTVVAMTDQEAVQAGRSRWENGSVIVLGGPELNQAASRVLAHCGNKVRLDSTGVSVEGKTYEGTNIALLVSCRQASSPDHVVTVFSGQSSAATAKVARLLFFYGWQSYLVFRDGAVVARGDFETEPAELEIRFDAH